MNVTGILVAQVHREAAGTERSYGAMEIKITRPRVVLAEDHAPMAQQLRALLAPVCDIVGSAEDGAALVAAVEALEPDVIVSDITMPGMSGLAAARLILARRPSARIVFVTVRDEPSVIRAAVQCGALAYVLKGDAGDELVTAVRAVAAGQPYLSTNARVVRLSPLE